MNAGVESLQPTNQAKDIFSRQSQAYLADPYPELNIRKDRINRMIGLLVDHQYVLCEAVEADYGRGAVETTRMQEIMTPIAALKYARKKSCYLDGD